MMALLKFICLFTSLVATRINNHLYSSLVTLSCGWAQLRRNYPTHIVIYMFASLLNVMVFVYVKLSVVHLNVFT